MKLNLRFKHDLRQNGPVNQDFRKIAGWAIGLLTVVFGMRDILNIPEWLAIPLGIVLFFVCLFVAGEFIR